jgi:hypothetical protein
MKMMLKIYFRKKVVRKKVANFYLGQDRDPVKNRPNQQHCRTVDIQTGALYFAMQLIRFFFNLMAQCPAYQVFKVFA